MNPRIVVFDLDDTLVDSSVHVLSGFQFALEPYGFKVTAEDIERMRSCTSEQLFRDVLPEVDAKCALQRLWAHSQECASRISLIPGVRDLLCQLRRDSRFHLAIWTGRDRLSTLEILKAHGLIQLFDVIASGSCVRQNKPAPDGLHLISHEFGVSPSFMVHIGDHEHDILGAKSVGAFAVHARWGGSQHSKRKLEGADLAFDTVPDLRLLLEQICGI